MKYILFIFYLNFNKSHTFNKYIDHLFLQRLLTFQENSMDYNDTHGVNNLFTLFRLASSVNNDSHF